MATSHPDHALISSNDVEGTAVYDESRKKIGEIDHLMIDKLSGRVIYAILSFGGFMSLRNQHYPLPWDALSYDVELAGFRTKVREVDLRDAPEFNDDFRSSREWERRLHDYYTRHYWGT